jgi:hypothetical protein
MVDAIGTGGNMTRHPGAFHVEAGVPSAIRRPDQQKEKRS